jgi:hypothetical protein
VGYVHRIGVTSFCCNCWVRSQCCTMHVMLINMNSCIRILCDMCCVICLSFLNHIEQNNLISCESKLSARLFQRTNKQLMLCHLPNFHLLPCVHCDPLKFFQILLKTSLPTPCAYAPSRPPRPLIFPSLKGRKPTQSGASANLYVPTQRAVSAFHTYAG